MTREPGDSRLIDRPTFTGHHPHWRGLLQSLAIVLGVVGFGAGLAALAPGRTAPAYTPVPMSESSAASPRPRWLVDGFNVLHTSILRGRDRGSWWRADGRRQLLDRVAAFDPGEAEVCVVFDGPRPAEVEEAASPALVFAPSADEWLLKEIRASEDPGALVLVTADRPLADKARHHGARVVSPGAFLERCKA